MGGEGGGVGGGLRGVWFRASSMIRDRSVHHHSVGLSFGKPFLAFLQVFIEEHGQVPDHKRQYDPGEEFGCMSELRFQRDPQFRWEGSVSWSYRCRVHRPRVLIQELRLEEESREHLNVDRRGVQTGKPSISAFDRRGLKEQPTSCLQSVCPTDV